MLRPGAEGYVSTPFIFHFLGTSLRDLSPPPGVMVGTYEVLVVDPSHAPHG